MELVINILSIGAIAIGYAILRWVLAPRLTAPSRRDRSRGSEGPAPAIGSESLPSSFHVYPVSDSAAVSSVSPRPSSFAANGTASAVTATGAEQTPSAHDAA